MKSQRLIIFLIICLLIFYGNSFGQKNTQNFSSLHNKSPYEPHLWGPRPIKKSDLTDPQVGMVFNKQIKLTPFEKPSSVLNLPGCALPQNHYVNSLGLICRQEWKLDKISPVAVRLRLGSLDYVNYLERKPNSSFGH